MIPLASPGAQYQTHKGIIATAIARVLDSGDYILGAEVARFERSFAGYCSVEHAVGVGSGTDALILTLRSLGIGPGDEVITVSHTAVATVAAIIATGATPVLVDIDESYYTIDATLIGEAIGPRTKAIIAVHLYGQPADLDAIGAVAKHHDLYLIEDCAQAAGASFGTRLVGGIGDAGCFSFYPTKNLGAIGDGGMAVTADGQIAANIRRLRQYGWDESRVTHEAGLNSRLDPLQAAILGAKLPHLSAENARRAAIAASYAQGLSGLPVDLPAVRERCVHAYHLYVIASDDRDALADHLRRCGIGFAIHYPVPVHRQKGYADRVRVPQEGLPVTERVVRRIISLPIYPELGDADAEKIIAAVREFYRA